MNTNTFMVGALVLTIFLGAPTAAALSFVLLRLYRRSVRKGMRQKAGVDPAPGPPDAVSRDQPPLYPLSLVSIHTGDQVVSASANPREKRSILRIQEAMRRTARVYIIAGLVYAAILSISYLVMMTRVGSNLMLLPIGVTWWALYPLRFLLFLWWYSWPTVLTLSLILTTSPRRRFTFIGLYFLSYLSIVVIGVAAASMDKYGTAPTIDFIGMLAVWLLFNGTGSLLLGAFLNRRVRAVGPLVLTFTLLAISGISFSLFGFSYLVDQHRELIYSPIGLLFFGTLGSFFSIFLIILVGLLVCGLVGFLLVRWLGRSYQHKRISDQSIHLDAIWLYFAIYSVLLFIPYSFYILFAGLAAFLAYKLVSVYGLRRLRVYSAAAPTTPILLLLRVFSLGARSQRLFDALSQRWLYAGSLTLIAGRDLLTAIVEPHEFLAFLGGRISRQFVQDQADLEHRMASIDSSPDPDGRYRVNEFFCRADTWRMTMQRLASSSDAILMDLRSFAPTNRGCLYEIEQLLSLIPLDRCLLLVDDTTDKTFLEQSIQSLWQAVPAESPNRMIERPKLRILHVSTAPEREVETLIQLFEHGAALEPSTPNLPTWVGTV